MRQGKQQSARFDKLIVSIGRVPHTAGLDAAERSAWSSTSAASSPSTAIAGPTWPGVWAIGDVVRGPMLAHKAEEEGVAVAERIAGQHGHVDFNTVPWVIYTAPGDRLGRPDRAAAQGGRRRLSCRDRFLSRPTAAPARSGDTSGFVKFLADAKTDRILGMHAIGPMVSELIAEGVVAMEFGAASEDIARICHAHPSLAEAVKEAALAVDRRTLNF